MARMSKPSIKKSRLNRCSLETRYREPHCNAINRRHLANCSNLQRKSEAVPESGQLDILPHPSATLNCPRKTGGPYRYYSQKYRSPQYGSVAGTIAYWCKVRGYDASLLRSGLTSAGTKQGMEDVILGNLHAGAHLSLTPKNLTTIWKVIITTMSGSIIPVDLLTAATNPGYFTNLVTTNLSDPTTIALLSYNDTFRLDVLGENATAKRLWNLDWQAFHEVSIWSP